MGRVCACVLAAIAAGGCYESHERFDDAGAVDSGPQPIPREDAGAPDEDANVVVPACATPWLRTDAPTTSDEHLGPVAASDEYAMWMPTNRLAHLVWFERATGEVTTSDLDGAYSQDASVLFTGGSFFVAFEHTGPTGTDEGVFLARIPPAPGDAEWIVRISATGGDPVIARGPSADRMLIAWLDDGLVAAEVDTAGAIIHGRTVIDGGTGLLGIGAAASSERYFAAHDETLHAIDPITFEAEAIGYAEPYVRFRGLGAVSDGLFSAHLGGPIRAWSLEGAPLAERSLGDPRGDWYPESSIAVFGAYALVVERRSGQAFIAEAGLEGVYDPGTFVPDVSEVGSTPNGFVVLATSLPVGLDPTISFIERCED